MQASTRTIAPQKAPEKRPTTKSSFTSPAPSVSRPAILSAAHDVNSDPTPRAHAPAAPANAARNAEAPSSKTAVHATSAHQIAAAPKSAPWEMMRSRTSTKLIHARTHANPAQANPTQNRSQTNRGICTEKNPWLHHEGFFFPLLPRPTSAILPNSCRILPRITCRSRQATPKTLPRQEPSPPSRNAE